MLWARRLYSGGDFVQGSGPVPGASRGSAWGTVHPETACKMPPAHMGLGTGPYERVLDRPLRAPSNNAAPKKFRYCALVVMDFGWIHDSSLDRVQENLNQEV